MAAVDDLLTCAICLDWFKSPRRLPCHHVYCLQCLQGLVKKETDHITCPECRRDHVMPNNRVEEFPVDGRLEQLIEKLAKPKPGSDTVVKDCSAISKCEHCQSACQECQKKRALLLESLLQESQQFRADFFRENLIITRQKQKAQLLRHKKNLCKLRMKVSAEIKDIIKELEKRKLTLLSIIEGEEKLIVDDLSKLDQADIICAEHDSRTADIVGKVLPTETLVSFRVKLSKQKELMTSLNDFGQDVRILRVNFNRDELRKMIFGYGDFVTASDYRNNFTLATTLDGSESGGMFREPWGLTVCPLTDNVYVTDKTSIRVYNSDGEYIRHVVTNDEPTGLAVDSNQRVIVASSKDNIVKVYTNQLKLIISFRSTGIKNGEFRWPMGVACDRNDNIYVTIRRNPRIEVFTLDGIFLSMIGRDILQCPYCVQINKREEILVTDYTLCQVLIFSKNGRHLRSIGGNWDSKLKGPYGICLDKNNRILVADQTSKKIQVYNDDGRHHITFTQPAAAMMSMYGLAVTKSGVIFITDYCGNQVHRIVAR